jgi:hypothetical protein
MQYKSRIDIRVAENKFNLSHVTAGGNASKIELSKANWLLTRDQEKHWFVETILDEQWSEVYIEFISGGAGEISIEFRGGWFDDLSVNHHEVWVSDIEIEGMDKENQTAGLIWHDEPLVRKIVVVAGKKYKVSARFKPNAI